MSTVEGRVEHLEAQLEGLQDALYRHQVLVEGNIGKLRSRTEPEQMARPQRRRSKTRPLMASRARHEDLQAEARYRCERLELYRAKTDAGRPTSPARLRELERAYAGAQARLHWAEHERANQD